MTIKLITSSSFKGIFFSNLDTIETSDEESIVKNEFRIKAIVENALMLKKEGASLIKEKRYDEANKVFHKAIAQLDTILDNNISFINYSNLTANKMECLLNVSICYINSKQYENAIKYTDKVNYLN